MYAIRSYYVQLSIDLRMSPSEHFHIGKKLATLRDEQILVLASGNLVHNLMAYNWKNPQIAPPACAVEFEHWNREQLSSGRPDRITSYNVCYTKLLRSVLQYKVGT